MSRSSSSSAEESSSSSSSSSSSTLGRLAAAGIAGCAGCCTNRNVCSVSRFRDPDPHCHKSLGIFPAKGRSAPGNKFYSKEFSEVFNPFYSWLQTEPQTIIRYTVDGYIPGFCHTNLLLNIVIILKYYYYINMFPAIARNITRPANAFITV